MKKTNAVRLLDQHKVNYELHPYTYDPENLDVAVIAGNLKQPVAAVCKTLVAKGDRTGVVVSVIPGDKQLNYKSLAALSGNKKISLVAVKELQGLTGYIRGGCSPIGMKKQYPIYIDQSALSIDKIFINAGQRGLMIALSSQDLVEVTKAEVEVITVV